MITRAQIRRQLRKNGGIMNAVPRQGYFLGKLVRGVKKAVGKVGDIAGQVVKSPVGKAALLGLGAYYGGPSIMKGLGSIGPRIGQGLGAMKSGLFGSAVSNLRAAGMPSFLGETGFTSVPGILGKLGLTKGGGSMALTGLGKLAGGAGLLTYFMSKGKTEEEAKELAQDVKRGEGLGLDIIQEDMKNYRSGALSGSQAYDKGYRFLTPRNYMQAATGGRVGFQQGARVDPRMQQSYARNVAENEAQREINQSLRSGNVGNLFSQYSIANAPRFTGDIGRPTGILSNQMDALRNEIAGRMMQNRNVTTSPAQPSEPMPGPLVDMAGTSIAELDRIRDQVLAQQAASKPTFEQRTGGESWDTLSTGDQKRIASEYPEMNLQVRGMAKGGRVELKKGSKGPHGKTDKEVLEELYPTLFSDTTTSIEGSPKKKKNYKKKADGGRIGKYGGGVTTAMPRIPTGMPRVNAGGISELDYRQEGGFVPMGVKEKADDVPAMLSKNEFVMTADAVKGAGGGNVEKGAQKMYNTMKQLEGRIA